MSIRRVLVAFIALGSLIVAPGPSQGDTFRVKAVGDSPATFKFKPGTKAVVKGSKIVWKNRSNTAHHIQGYSDNWNFSKDLPRDGKVSKTFRQKGAYYYRCTVPGHSSLNGDECSGMCGLIHIH